MIDEAGARVRLKAMTRPPDLKEIDDQIEQLNQEKEAAVAEQDFEKAAHLRDQADKLKKKKEHDHHANGARSPRKSTASSMRK